LLDAERSLEPVEARLEIRPQDSDVESVLRTREMVEFLAAQGAEPLVTSPKKFLEMLQADIAKWAKLVEGANVKLD